MTLQEAEERAIARWGSVGRACEPTDGDPFYTVGYIAKTKDWFERMDMVIVGEGRTFEEAFSDAERTESGGQLMLFGCRNELGQREITAQGKS
jgi:hypothetical protein